MVLYVKIADRNAIRVEVPSQCRAVLREKINAYVKIADENVMHGQFLKIRLSKTLTLR